MTDGLKIHTYNRLLDCFKFGNLDKFMKCLDEGAKEGFSPAGTFKSQGTGYVNLISLILNQIITGSRFDMNFDPFPFLDAALSYSRDIDTPVVIDYERKNLIKHAIDLDGDVQKKCECIRLLAKHGANINSSGNSAVYLYPPLFYAGESAVVETLLRHGADPNYMAFTYDIPGAPRKGESVIEHFLKKHITKPNIHARRITRDYARMFEDAAKSIELLIKFGAPVNTDETNLSSPLMSLCELKQAMLAVRLRYAGKSREDVTPVMDGYLPYLDAFLERTFDMLVDAGADVNHRDCTGNSPATVCTSSKLLRKLMESGYTGDDMYRHDKPLISGVMDRMEEDSLYHTFCDDEDGLIEIFLEQTKLHNRDPLLVKTYEAVLPKAVKYGCTGIIRRLVEAGADINCRNKVTGKTPLFSLFLLAPDLKTMCDTDVLSLMRDLGADFSAADKDGNTPLHFCATLFTGNPSYVRAGCRFDETLDALVKSGADIDAVNNSGYTPAAILVKGAGRNEWGDVMPLLVKMIELGADMYKGGESSAMELIAVKKHRRELERCIEQKRRVSHVMDDMIDTFER